MDKIVKAFCEQYKKIEIKCSNPKCNYKKKLKSKDVFKHSEYKFKCPKCKETTIFDLNDFFKQFRKNLKKRGITIIHH